MRKNSKPRNTTNGNARILPFQHRTGHPLDVGSSIVTNNKFDISSNTAANSAACPNGTTKVESIVLEMGASKSFSFSSNNVNCKGCNPVTGVSWDALEIINGITAPCDAQGTVGDNGFANNTSFQLNAINYNNGSGAGTCASIVPLLAVGNAYNSNVIAPDPANPSIVLGTQPVTMAAVGTQSANSTKYFPVSGVTNSVTLTSTQASQVWGQIGVVNVNSSNCGFVTAAPGTGQTYTFHLEVNGSLVAVVCTFSGTSQTGVGSGTPQALNATDTVVWKAMQSMSSQAANPTVNLIFARH